MAGERIPLSDIVETEYLLNKEYTSIPCVQGKEDIQIYYPTNGQAQVVDGIMELLCKNGQVQQGDVEWKKGLDKIYPDHESSKIDLADYQHHGKLDKKGLRNDIARHIADLRETDVKRIEELLDIDIAQLEQLDMQTVYTAKVQEENKGKGGGSKDDLVVLKLYGDGKHHMQDAYIKKSDIPQWCRGECEFPGRVVLGCRHMLNRNDGSKKYANIIMVKVEE